MVFDWPSFLNILDAQRQAAQMGEIEQAEQQLGVSLPKKLRELLLVSDGVFGKYGEDIVWSVREIVERNREMRTTSAFRELYMPFDCLLFVGDLGNGDLIGFRVLGDALDEYNLFHWDHETDEHTSLFKPFETYLMGSLVS